MGDSHDIKDEKFYGVFNRKRSIGLLQRVAFTVYLIVDRTPFRIRKGFAKDQTKYIHMWIDR